MLKNPLLILTICSLASFSAYSNEVSETENTDTIEVTADTSVKETSPAMATEPSDDLNSATVNDTSTDPSADIDPVAIAAIREDTPRQYIVKSGDTLWAIAGHFLNDPWYWPELWAKNPQINNPHLIYPGDIISLIYVNGQPVFQVSRNGQVVNSSAGINSPQTAATKTETQPETNIFEQVHTDGPLKHIKLSPRIRSTDLKESIKTIPLDAIVQFTTQPQVITLKEWEDAPYIVGSDDKHLILSQGNRIYIRGELDKEKLRYNIYRKGEQLTDPKTGDLLGYEIIYAGETRITKYASPTSAIISKAKREIIVGDRLFSADNAEINNLFFPKPPEADVDGEIISLFDAISGIAQYQIAVINLGKRDGLEIGNLLATYTKGEVVRDRYENNEGQINVTLPNERSGMMMLFKTFDRVSYGLILEADRVIHRHDQVRTPFK